MGTLCFSSMISECVILIPTARFQLLAVRPGSRWRWLWIPNSQISRLGLKLRGSAVFFPPDAVEKVPGTDGKTPKDVLSFPLGMVFFVLTNHSLIGWLTWLTGPQEVWNKTGRPPQRLQRPSRVVYQPCLLRGQVTYCFVTFFLKASLRFTKHLSKPWLRKAFFYMNASRHKIQEKNSYLVDPIRNISELTPVPSLFCLWQFPLFPMLRLGDPFFIEPRWLGGTVGSSQHLQNHHQYHHHHHLLHHHHHHYHHHHHHYYCWWKKSCTSW